MRTACGLLGRWRNVDLRCHHDEGHPLPRCDHRAGVRRRHIPPLLPRHSAPPADYFAPLRLRPPAPSSLDGDRRATTYDASTPSTPRRGLVAKAGLINALALRSARMPRPTVFAAPTGRSGARVWFA